MAGGPWLLLGAGGARTEGLCEGEERVWAVLGEKMPGVGAPSLRLTYQRLAWVVVAMGTKLEKGMRKTMGSALRLVGTDGGGQMVGVGGGAAFPWAQWLEQ